jgi:hypothetical protein
LINGEPVNDRYLDDFINAVNGGMSNLIINRLSDSTHFVFIIKANSIEIFYSVKKNYNLICGLNKFEADNILLDEIKNYRKKYKYDTAFIPSGLALIGDSVYAAIGSEFMRTLSSTFYVVKSDSTFVPLFHKSYPVESFITTILRPSSSIPSIDVVLEHNQYNDVRLLGVQLEALVEFFAKDHQLFFGVEDSVKMYSGTLIAHNSELNYLHLLYFQTSYDVMFGIHPEYRCKLYSFIPTYNVKNLFSPVNMDKQVRYKVKRP